jgi:hypothetical protein
MGELATVFKAGQTGKLVVVLSLIVGLPLLGMALIGAPVRPYLEFPPQTRMVQPSPFSWPVFLGLTLLIVMAVGPLVWRVAVSSQGQKQTVRSMRSFPWWGVLGAAVTGVAWVVAWNRFPSFAVLQGSTFTPLWVGYILIVNGWTFRRTGHCLMLDEPRGFVTLFPVSAVFWWCFEYLNRFVQNWYYVGGQDLTAWEYVVQATIPFSTVLPAVMSTMELLFSIPVIQAGMDRLPALRWPRRRFAGQLLLIGATIGLAGIGIWPEWLFPVVWIAPLFLITALQLLAGEQTIFSEAETGDWTTLWLAALSALLCGLCWEMWNSGSVVHWEYAIPSVHGFALFEMPLLGYAGYLPFGLECLAVATLVLPRRMFLRPPDGNRCPELTSPQDAPGTGVLRRVS